MLARLIFILIAAGEDGRPEDIAQAIPLAMNVAAQCGIGLTMTALLAQCMIGA